nr:PREDICTED: uncharacterized protein LOC105668132 [Linepithema humile]
MYFKYSNKLFSQCIICNANLSTSKSKNLEDHLNSHSKEQRKNHILRHWTRKYWTQRNDFVVECNICYVKLKLSIEKNLNFHTRNKHLDKLKNMQETHDPVDSSERVSSLETNITFMSLNIATKKHIWKYYINLMNFKAQCKFCEDEYNYIDHKSFKRHITKLHEEIWKYEEGRKRKKLPWMYFKYSNELFSQCIICNANLSTSKSKDLEDHLNSHSKEQRKNHILRHWTRKYWTQRNDFVVECNICYVKLSLFIQKSLDYHTRNKHSDKLKNMQEIHDPVDSSERVSSLETNITFMSLNIATEKYIWKYYINLMGFEAQCKFCEKKYNYTDNENFIRHIAKLHKEIWKYEDGGKLRKWPWMYFKYSNIFSSQCIICDAKVLSTSKFVEDHLNSHSKDQQNNHILQSWTEKYWSKRNDFVVECNICHDNLTLSILECLDSHIKETHSDKLKNTQEIHDPVDSSECVSSLEMDTMSMTSQLN